MNAIMLKKKIKSIKKLAGKANVIAVIDHQASKKYDSLKRERSKKDKDKDSGLDYISTETPIGFVAVYVGEERQRFVVPTGYLSHPLFKMLLEKASEEFGFDQKSGLVVPCSISAFHEVVSAVECCNGNFNFGDFVEEFI